ncbi:MAG: zinc-ribbon domain-containing protein [Maricaulaceae bacterium]
MILTCPACSTRYSVADENLRPAGRTLRCSNCATSWFAEPPQPLDLANSAPVEDLDLGAPVQTAPDPAPEPAPSVRTPELAFEVTTEPASTPLAPHTQIRKKAEAKRRRKAMAIAAAAWAGVLLVFGVGYGVAYALRYDIAAAWPQTASAFALVGVSADPYGLAIEDFDVARGFDGDMPIIEVAGVVRNVTNRTRPLPALRLDLRDPEGVTAFTWTTDVREAPLAPGEAAPFRSRVGHPPPEGVDVVASFAKPKAIPQTAAQPPHNDPGDAHPKPSPTTGDDHGHATTDTHAAAH